MQIKPEKTVFNACFLFFMCINKKSGAAAFAAAVFLLFVYITIRCNNFYKAIRSDETTAECRGRACPSRFLRLFARAGLVLMPPKRPLQGRAISASAVIALC